MHTAASLAARPFSVLAPVGPPAPVVFNAPHSGRVYPVEFLGVSRLSETALRRSEDFMVDDLFSHAPQVGAPLLVAHFPRAYLDANREPYELDPRMFDGRLPAFANTRSLRVAGGLGAIPRIVGDGQEIYRGRLPVAEALRRIEELHKPYHAALGRLVQEARRRFGEAILVDCHSMPAASVCAEGSARADVVLGDRYGASCGAHVVDCAQNILDSLGFRVVRNRPYAGGYITETFGQPASGVHALQIEINRGLYMDEGAMRVSAGYADVEAALATFVALFVSAMRDASINARRHAAE